MQKEIELRIEFGKACKMFKRSNEGKWSFDWESFKDNENYATFRPMLKKTLKFLNKNEKLSISL